MSAVIVELTGDEASLLKSLQNVIQKQVEWERKLHDTGQAGDAAGIALQEAFGKVKSAGDEAMKGLLRELKMVGPEGSTAAAALQQHLRATGQAGFRSMESILDQIRLIDPAAAEAAAAAASAMDTAAVRSAAAWHEQIRILRSMGPEGAKAATEIEMNLAQAAHEARGGMEAVLQQLEAINPAVGETATRIRHELGDAARFSEREFTGVLNELRSLGPTGQTAAAQIRKHLVDAGQIAEKSMEDVADKLHAIDPAAAKMARQVIASLKTVETEGESIFDSFSVDAIAKVGLVALAFDKVRDAIAVVGDAFKKQLDLMEEAREANLDLAGAQQEALKNLANFSGADQKRVLDVVIPKVQEETLFPSQRDLTIAASNLASSGASSVEQIDSFLTESAKVTRLTPENVDEYALGGLLISKATGLPARESLNLLFQGGANSQLVDPADVAKSLPNALIAGFATAKVTDENREAATAQTAAFFGASTEFAVDQTGDSSRTNVGKLLGFIEKLTADLPNDPGLPLERLKLIQQDETLKAQFLKELPAEQAFLPSFRKLVDPTSDAFQAVEAKVPKVNVGTAAIDEFEKNMAIGTRAMNIAILETTDQARAELSQLGSGEGSSGAQLAEVRKVTANALRQNQTTMDFIADELFGWLPRQLGYELSVESGRLEGSGAAEETVSGIRELGALRANSASPEKQRNLAIAQQSLVTFIESSIDQMDPQEAARARSMIASPGEWRVDRETDQYLQRIATALDAIVASNAATAANTTPQPKEPGLLAPALSGLVP